MADLCLTRIVAVMLALAAGTPALAQVAQIDPTFPIDPYAQQDTSVASGANTSQVETGLPVDPFAVPTTQSSKAETVQDQNQGLLDSGSTANTGVGEVGQRQTALDVAPRQNALDRINNRESNRVENRLRNRIDRYYDPTANATSPFEDASRRTQDPGQPR